MKYCDYAWLILFKNRSSREDDSRIPSSLGISSYRVFTAASSFASSCPVDSTRVLSCFWFYISRFLLICHWESLNLIYTLRWFFFLESISEHHLRTVSGTGCSLTTLQQTFFNDFLLDFWANVFEVFKASFFWWWLSPRRLVLALRTVGRIVSLFLENFTLQVTNPLFLENDWFYGENLGLYFWVLWLRLSWVFSVG